MDQNEVQATGPRRSARIQAKEAPPTKEPTKTASSKQPIKTTPRKQAKNLTKKMAKNAPVKKIIKKTEEGKNYKICKFCNNTQSLHILWSK